MLKYQQNKKLITIVIPVFRNEGTLNLTYDHIVKLLPAISESYDCEFIFINDGSDDGSLDELLRIKKMDTRVKVLDFVRNFGQLYAVLAGFEFAKGDLLINISADMQDPPELILEMIRKWEEGYKVVLCARAEREDNFLARITSSIFYGIIKKALPQMPRGGFDYFLLDRIVYKKIFELDERNSFLQGDILWTGYKPNIIHYKRLKRHVGKSQWTIGKKLKYFIDGIINTSYFPIRLMSLIGIIISIIGFSYSGVILFAWFYHKTPFSGYAPIMMGLLTLSGVIMLMIGIVGEYLWRIYDEVRKRPKYLIKNFYTD